jgi:hypothetical protein
MCVPNNEFLIFSISEHWQALGHWRALASVYIFPDGHRPAARRNDRMSLGKHDAFIAADITLFFENSAGVSRV